MREPQGLADLRMLFPLRRNIQPLLHEERQSTQHSHVQIAWADRHIPRDRCRRCSAVAAAGEIMQHGFRPGAIAPGRRQHVDGTVAGGPAAAGSEYAVIEAALKGVEHGVGPLAAGL